MANFFKWLIVLSIPLFCLTFTSCGDGDKDEPEKPESEKSEDVFSIIGTWQCVEDEGEGFTFYQNGKVLEKDKGNLETTFYKFSQKEGKLWIYMFGESGVETYPSENMEYWDEYNTSIISESSFGLSYEIYGETITKTYKRIES